MSEKPRRRILVVDTLADAGKKIAKALSSEEFEVDYAPDGDEALKEDRAVAFDLIIVDQKLPGMSGLDLLRAIRAGRPGAAVIVTAGSPTIQSAVASIKLGAADYIAKTAETADLRAAVAAALPPAEVEAAPACALELAPLPVPSGYQCVLGHSWLKVEGGGIGTVGVVHDYLKFVGAVARLELPQVGDEVAQGTACCRLVDAAGVRHPIWSPASGRVIEINAALASDPSLVARDPYGEGFLFRIQPAGLEKDLKGLLQAR